jgi:hypothetical protein
MAETEQKKTNKGCLGCVVVFFSIVGLILICGEIYKESDSDYRSSSRSDNYSSSGVSPSSIDTYTYAAAHMWSGVKLYYGPNKDYYGDIVCFRGGYDGIIAIVNFHGTLERKNRAVIRNGAFYVRLDDPALKSMLYFDCDD